MISHSTGSHQRGFALATVLMMLLILALVVAALLSNQTLAVRETSDVLISATRAQASHNVHRACLKEVRQKMSVDVLNLANSVIDWQQDFSVTSGGVRGTCSVEAETSATPNSWTPRLRITTKLDNQTEISDWRYAACVNAAAATCFTAQAQLKIKTLDAATGYQTLTPVFLLDADVQTGWRKE